MPLVGTQNPWIAAAGGANAGADALAQTLLRLPAMRQQLQQGALQNQLLQGQIQFAPQLNAARLGQMQAVAGANTARAGLYGAEAGKYNAQAETIKGQNEGLAGLQEVLGRVAQGDNSPQTKAAFVQGLSKLDPKIMGKIVDNILQAKGVMNPQLMGSSQAQLAAILGSKQTGQNIPANGVNIPFGGGEPQMGLLRTAPGQQVADAGTGEVLASNTNQMGGAKSSGLAIAALRAAVADPNNVNPQQVIQAAMAYQQALQNPQAQAPTNAPAGQTNAANKKYTWTPQGLVPQQ